MPPFARAAAFAAALFCGVVWTGGTAFAGDAAAVATARTGPQPLKSRANDAVRTAERWIEAGKPEMALVRCCAASCGLHAKMARTRHAFTSIAYAHGSGDIRHCVRDAG